jgi:putative flavoprotein involved in K+ transport
MNIADLQDWVAAFSEALGANDREAIVSLFAPGAQWRDILAISWDLVTIDGSQAIAELLMQRQPETRLRAIETSADLAATEGWIRFQTAFGQGEGYIRLDGGVCLTILTALQSLEGFEEAAGPCRPSGASPDGDGRNWLERRQQEAAGMGREIQPYVLIIGGGQGGLALGARLKALDVPCLIVDKHPKVGDQWRSRYRSLTLHDPVWYDHMPYLPFPETWPVYTPKDKMGEWLELYARIMELDIWTSTECRSASYDDTEGQWTVNLVRDGQSFALRVPHLVMAVGNAGFPNVPTFDGAETFGGPMHHSSRHAGGAPYEGKCVAVIGSNNSAHDICADLVAHGADVTMIQRSSTLICRQKTMQDILLGEIYSQAAVEQGLTTEKADLFAASMPLRMQEEYYRTVWDTIRSIDADFYAQLEQAGFQLDFAEDGTGLAMKYQRTASGYYIDVGASEMIIDGRIALRSGVGVDRIVADGLLLTDGSHVAADAIVMATGFGSMDEWVARLISPDVAARIGKCWGYGSGVTGDPGPWEGELRNMWKPTAQAGLWFHGGNLAQSRFYSRYLALQLKGRYEKLPVSVYRKTP